MSEAELHQLRLRQGEQQKAARGELRLPLTAGLAYARDGRIVLNPDEEVQTRLRLVFSPLQTLHSAKAVMRELQRHALALPVRPLQGPAPHEVVRVEGHSARVLQILHNPTYAGAYVYGRRRHDPLRRCDGGAGHGTVKLPPEQWTVCLRDAHAGYIGWEEFMASKWCLAGNVPSILAQRPGAARRGLALLQGIATCGRCGRRMGLRYSGPLGDYAVYQCTADQMRDGSARCQEVRAMPVDAEVERLLLEALAPDQIVLAVAGVDQLQEDMRQLEQQWALKRERERYEAERARRQYDAVEPENRLVARSLERAWEARLRRVEEVEQAYQAWRREQGAPRDENDRADVLALAQDLLRVWQAATPQERKRNVRLVVREVVLDQKREPGVVCVRLCWHTGAVSEHRLQRRVRSYAECASAKLLERRIRELNAAAKMEQEIADILNAEAMTTARSVPLQHNNAYLLRMRWGIPTVKINGTEANPPRWSDGS